jgi:hypothetical protein
MRGPDERLIPSTPIWPAFAALLFMAGVSVWLYSRFKKSG